jgi:hypothetical protein
MRRYSEAVKADLAFVGGRLLGSAWQVDLTATPVDHVATAVWTCVGDSHNGFGGLASGLKVRNPNEGTAINHFNGASVRR